MKLPKIKTQCFNSIVLGILFSIFLFPISSNAQAPCGTDEMHESQMKTNLEYKRMYLEQNEEIRSFIQNKVDARFVDDQTVYTIPVVVHVIHLGEAEGSGSNISDFQITEAIRGLNERFRNIIGNSSDIQLEFCLAVRDPDGNLTTGINRVNGSGVQNFQQYGIGGSCEGTSASFLEVKSLSSWPVLDYYNIWVVHKICGGWAGYAYYPNGLYYDGTVILSNYMKYGASTLAHEIGHGFNLPHTFNGDGGNVSCPTNTNCTTQGDFICDTPPHKQKDCGSSNPCSLEGNWDNTRYNYMSYCGVSVGNARFTLGQKERMRATLNAYPRANLLNSMGCVLSEGNAITLVDISNPEGIICSSNQLEPMIKVGNIGSTTVSSFIIKYTHNDGAETKIKWTGTLLPNENVTVTFPLLNEVNGENTLNVKILLPNGKVDDLKYEQDKTVHFNLDPSACFVTVWKTNNPGPSGKNRITFPDYKNSEYNIYWEEVDNTSIHGTLKWNNYSTTITFPREGVYRLRIAPKENGLHRIAFYNSEDKSKIIDVEQWGKIAWSSFQEAFSGCRNLKVSALDVPNLSKVTDMSFMFNNASTFNQPIENWNVSNVKDMNYMFLGATSFNQPIGNWDVSNLISSINMFANATSFNQPIGNWNVSKVNNMRGMFVNASSFNQSIEDWDISSVTDMKYLFKGTISYNQPMEKWKVSNVTDMSFMFLDAISFNQPIGNWDISKVSNMESMLTNSGLDCQNYNKTLIGWANNPSIANSIRLGAEGIKYGAEGVEARNLLLSKGWTITDGELDEDCESIITSLNNRSKSDLLSVYPNPNQGSFTIEIFGENRNVTLEIVNVLGQKVYSQELKNLNGKQTIHADLSNHGKGVYWINLYCNNEVINKSVVKQ